MQIIKGSKKYHIVDDMQDGFKFPTSNTWHYLALCGHNFPGFLTEYSPTGKDSFDELCKSCCSSYSR